MASPSAARTDGANDAGARPDIAGWLRVGWRTSGLVAALVALLPLHYAAHLLGRPSHWPRVYLAMATRIIGLRVRVIGSPVRGGAIFIANHLSWLDVLAMGGATGTAFIAKAEVRETPVIGWLASINRTLYVARENRLGVARQVTMLRAALAENHAVTVFPEGTTGDGRSLLPFKSSLLGVVEPPPPGVVIQPVAIDYGEWTALIAWTDGEAGLVNAVRILSRPGRFTAWLHFLDPFDPANVGGRKAIAAESRRRVEAGLAALSPGIPPAGEML